MPEFAADVIRQHLALIDSDDMEHLLFFSRNNTPLAPYNVRRTFGGSSWRLAVTSTTKAHYAEPGRTVRPEPAAVLQRLAPPT